MIVQTQIHNINSGSHMHLDHIVDSNELVHNGIETTPQEIPDKPDINSSLETFLDQDRKYREYMHKKRLKNESKHT